MTAYIVALGAMLALDAAWLWIAKPMYGGAVDGVQQGRPMQVRAWAAVLAYAFMFLGMALLVLPALRNIKTRNGSIAFADVIRVAGSYGLSLYGVFNATVLAMFVDYPWQAALVDVTWGTALYITVAWAASRFL
jgi:uncharacterized membrane protein